MENETTPNWDFKERDIIILEYLAAEPQLSSRELAEILSEEHGIDISHVTVNNSIRDMRDAGVFREAIIPNEHYYLFSLFEFKFDPSHFKLGWRDLMEDIQKDKYTLFYFVTGGEYQWKAVMMFPDHETESRRIHRFYKEHGKVISNLRNSVVSKVFKFGTDSDIFAEMG
jgi:DNA-binding Lrp family transcriptional regulator